MVSSWNEALPWDKLRHCIEFVLLDSAVVVTGDLEKALQVVFDLLAALELEEGGGRGTTSGDASPVRSAVLRPCTCWPRRRTSWSQRRSRLPVVWRGRASRAARFATPEHFLAAHNLLEAGLAGSDGAGVGESRAGVSAP